MEVLRPWSGAATAAVQGPAVPPCPAAKGAPRKARRCLSAALRSRALSILKPQRGQRVAGCLGLQGIARSPARVTLGIPALQGAGRSLGDQLQAAEGPPDGADGGSHTMRSAALHPQAPGSRASIGTAIPRPRACVRRRSKAAAPERWIQPAPFRPQLERRHRRIEALTHRSRLQPLDHRCSLSPSATGVLAELEELRGAKAGTTQGDRLDIIATLIERMRLNRVRWTLLTWLTRSRFGWSRGWAAKIPGLPGTHARIRSARS